MITVRTIYNDFDITFIKSYTLKYRTEQIKRMKSFKISQNYKETFQAAAGQYCKVSERDVHPTYFQLIGNLQPVKEIYLAYR